MATDRRAQPIASKALEHLRTGGVALEAGLSDNELQQIESRLGCALPPDLRLLLSDALPSGPRLPTWRDLDNPALADQLAHPVEGLLFDVEHNGFWHDDWPARPRRMRRAIATARTQLQSAPVLIPVYGHRYLPSQPCESGNPVLSVMQTDIIYYGRDLAEYAANEHLRRQWQVTEPVVVGLPFWGHFLEGD